MSELNGRQRRHLRGKAHALTPSVHVGRQGVTAAVRAQADAALATHELVKVRLAADRPERGDQAAELAAAAGAALVGCIGKVAILYRPHEELSERTVELPDG